jgi:membrane protein
MKSGLASQLSLWTMALVAAALASRLIPHTPLARSTRGRLMPPQPLPEVGAQALPDVRAEVSNPAPASSETLRDPIERGRSAVTPAQIPARGWKEIVARVWANISRHRVLAIAAGVTFYALLAVFPAIAAIVAIYSLFADPSTIRAHLDSLSTVLPSGAVSVLGDQISRIAAQGRASLGVATLIGLAVSLWSANAGMKAVFDALNVVYQEDEKRGFFKLNAQSLGFTVAAVVLALLALAAVVALPPALSFIGLSSKVQNWIDVLRWPLLLLCVTLAASVIYRYGPSRNEAKWRWLSWGAVLFAVGWLAASLMFSWYTSSFGNFNQTYGSLGAVVGFMMWIWITNIVLLTGAEVNAEMEHQTARDTTRGETRPMGRRGAVVANTVAPAGE